MIHYNMYFESYDWCIEVFIILEHCFLNEIMNSLKGSSQSEMQKAFMNITTRLNSGLIKTMGRKSIIVINKPTTLEEFINVYNHEKNHLEMHICEYFDIDPYSEEASEMSGHLAKYLFNSMANEVLEYYINVSKM